MVHPVHVVHNSYSVIPSVSMETPRRTFNEGQIVRYQTRGRRPFTTTVHLDAVHGDENGTFLASGRVVSRIREDSTVDLGMVRRILTKGDLSRAEVIREARGATQE